jgi:plasmid stabilization system protein ParE
VISRTPFIAIYRLKGAQRIEIIRLLHGSQQWPAEGSHR